MTAEEILYELILDLSCSGANMADSLEEKKETARALIAEFKVRVMNECEQLDGKFCGFVWRRKDGKVEEQFVIFVPRDNLVPELLSYYAALCVDNVVGPAQIQSVSRLQQRVQTWRDVNLTSCKLPDVNIGENVL
jgi:hypothetical protein